METGDLTVRILSDVLADYRVGEVPPPSPVRIARWLEQFPPEEQPGVLSETTHLFRRLYVSRERTRELLRAFIQRYVVGEEEPEEALGRTQFLRVQARGGSQRAMLRLADELLREEWGTPLRRCGERGAERFVYLDDAIYTGNRLRRDLASQEELAPGWLARAAPEGCDLLIYVTCAHASGWRFALEHVRREAARRGIRFRLYPGLVLENERLPESPAHCLWPEPLPTDVVTTPYVAAVREDLRAKGLSPGLLFRPEGTPEEETLFSSPEARRTLEQAFLRSGARILAAGDAPRNMRPLGFDALDTLGFGTLFTSYRNIANNCPLALWWDRPGVWTPLLPRRVNPRGRQHEGNWTG